MNTVKKESKAKFLVISQEIEKRIDKGTYVPAQKLPSEYDLALEFGVSRLTVRKALEDLMAKQIVIKKKGKGAYVIEQSKIQSGGMGLKSFTEAAEAMGKVGQTQLLHFQKLNAAPEEVEQALHKTAELVELKRLRLLDDEPMTLEELYFSEQLIIGATETELTGSLFSLIEEKIEISYSHQEIEAILATEELAQLLEVQVNSPIFRVRSTAFAVDARPILYDISYYRADKYSFKNTLIRQH